MIQTITETEFFIVMIVLWIIMISVFIYVGKGWWRLWKNRKKKAAALTIQDAINQVIQEGRKFTLKELSRMGNPSDSNGRTIAHYMAINGHFFKFEELRQLGNPPDERGWTIAHEMASKGYIFDISELMTLGNPSTTIGWDIDRHPGWTVAHEMAKHGHEFCLSELVTLRNPATINGVTVAHEMAKRGAVFSLSGLLDLGNPATINGQTVAHEMAKLGRQFKVSELTALGNPKNADGLTIGHLMASHGYSFTLKELAQLGSPVDVELTNIRGVHLTYRNGAPIFSDGEKVGNQVGLHFGCARFDDWFFSEVHFDISVDLTGSEWSFSLKMHQVEPDSEFMSQESRILQLIDELKEAAHNHQYFDFVEYISFWKHLDEFFQINVSKKMDGR